ncbi:MAG: hypothetical protein AAGA42_15515 [Actinomycetota bacterium]
MSSDATAVDALLMRAEWSDDDVAAAGVEIVDVPFVTVGGGMGSFTMVDTLRVAGVSTDQVAVLSDLDTPSATYEYLATNSQIPRGERLRSDSGSVMDNVWGWPGYALREAVADKRVQPAWQAMSEPILTEYFTPRAGQVYESVGREAARIGWASMLRPGVVRTVRRRAGRDGGYFVLHTPAGAGESSAGQPARRVAYRCEHAHVAVGYPGVKMLPDLQAYRERYQDWARVVNAYEPHNHVYEECLRRPCTVVIRGSGIVASRVLQRIIDDRDNSGAQTRILHLFRSYPDGPQGDSIFFRRPARKGWAYQAFNYPKAAWGGQLRDQLDQLEGSDRAALLDEMGGTNTAPRRDWREQLERGARDGFYRQLRGTVSDVEPVAGQAEIRTMVRPPDGGTLTFDADFIVDATGLEADIEEHRVLADLLDHAGARKNPKGRLDVERDFIVRGTDSGNGRLYASGSITLGGYYAGVDSFLGLQYAALRIADSLAAHGFGKRIGPLRSLSQWWRWARNRPI